jgi:hypothetical protein
VNELVQLGAEVILTSYVAPYVDVVRERLHEVGRRAARKAVRGELAPCGRVVVKALEEAAWTDEQIVAEYLGGVLAASQDDDDDAVSVVALIGRLSALALRAHFVAYREARRVWVGSPLDVAGLVENGHLSQAVRVRADEYWHAVGLNGDPARVTFASVYYRLRNEDLFSSYGWPGAIDESTGEEYLRFNLTLAGAELFLWGTGLPGADPVRLFDLGDHWPEWDLDVPSCPSAERFTAS